MSLQSSVTDETCLRPVDDTHFLRAEQTVDNSHVISMFRYRLDFIMPRYTRIIHLTPWWNVCIFDLKLNGIVNLKRRLLWNFPYCLPSHQMYKNFLVSTAISGSCPTWKSHRVTFFELAVVKCSRFAILIILMISGIFWRYNTHLPREWSYCCFRFVCRLLKLFLRFA